MKHLFLFAEFWPTQGHRRSRAGGCGEEGREEEGSLPAFSHLPGLTQELLPGQGKDSHSHQLGAAVHFMQTVAGVPSLAPLN